MSIRVGTDIVYIPRIQALVTRFGNRFLQRVYTPNEQQSCGLSNEITRMAINKLAGRWAAKEAVVKALGTGWRGISYTDVEICRHPKGVPFVVLHNNALEIVAKWELDNYCQLSLSHDGDYATATAIFVAPGT
ncbi:acyl-carrier protein synthase [Calothrix sp. NIES-4071]|nr:acyl-carrier protein synthase [Calothrix sp. NIES-4071]BAZ55778.1 acyl-carrier protein synthase [Calothrix sp. NIES-4105]